MLRTPSARLFILSFLVLFFELTMIRWTAANVFYVGYFTNFVLLACLLGIGIGCMGAGWKRQVFGWFPFAAAALVAVITVGQFDVDVSIKGQIHFQESEPTDESDPQGTTPQTEADPSENDQRSGVPIWAVLPLLFASVAGLFVCLAQPLSGLLKSLPPLRAYTLNIVGSLAGILAYTLVAFLELPCPAWFAISFVLFFMLAEQKGRRRFWHAAAAIVCVALTCLDSIGAVYWSPYYKIRLRPLETTDGSDSYEISVNGVSHQVMTTAGAMGNIYRTPYEFFRGGRPFRDVLIIGAGSGGDAAVALRYGVENADAVEIDPVIYELGEKYHPDRPYQSPRIHKHITDGRAYLESTTKNYDMIIFALPDSLTLASAYSSLRLENFLFTMEAFQTVRGRLKDDGLFVLYNYYREHWYILKLARMLQSVFEDKPAVFVWKGQKLLPAVLMAGGRLGELPPEFRQIQWDWESEPPPGVDPTSLKNATDDWPFTYLKRPAIPVQYLLMFACLAPLCVLVVRRARPKAIGAKPAVAHFFFMGAGFFLLEAKSLVQFALLFGSTWLVNSLVFFAILSAVLVANLIVSKVRFERVWPIAVALSLTIVLNYFISLESLLFENWALRYVVASAVIFSPIFFANLLFSRFFRDTRVADLGFAANLLGTLAGGVMEYAALILGYRRLMILVGLCYVLALAAAPWKRNVGDDGGGP